MTSSGDDAPQIESVRTTSTDKREVDAEGKEHKESSQRTEVKTDGEFAPVTFPERPSLLQADDKSDPMPAVSIEIESPSPIKPGK